MWYVEYVTTRYRLSKISYFNDIQSFCAMQQKTFELTFNSVGDVYSAHIRFKAQQFYIVSFEYKCEKRAKKCRKQAYKIVPQENKEKSDEE